MVDVNDYRLAAISVVVCMGMNPYKEMSYEEFQAMDETSRSILDMLDSVRKDARALLVKVMQRDDAIPDDLKEIIGVSVGKGEA